MTLEKKMRGLWPRRAGYAAMIAAALLSANLNASATPQCALLIRQAQRPYTIHVENNNPRVAVHEATGLAGLALTLAVDEIKTEKGRNSFPDGDYNILLDLDSITASSEYSSVSSKELNSIDFSDKKTKQKFLISMERLAKYELEPIIQKYCERFGISKDYVIPFLIQESNMNVSTPTTRGGCTGIGQVTESAVRSVNSSFGTHFRHTNSPKLIEDQVGSAVGYFSLKVNELQEKYGIGEGDAARLSYFAYNAGGAPLNLVASDLKKKGMPLSWENVEPRITPELLRRSSGDYRTWSRAALRQKVGIIKGYVRDTEKYHNYLGQLK